jgi:hypothetical protein
MHNATNLIIKNDMATIIVKKVELPVSLPQGWKKRVAEDLGFHRNTVGNNLRLGKGPVYERIVQAAAQRYGRIVESNNQ